MDEKEYRLLILETLQETNKLSRKLLETPLLITDDELIALEYNLKMINEYSKEIINKRGLI